MSAKLLPLLSVTGMSDFWTSSIAPIARAPTYPTRNPEIILPPIAPRKSWLPALSPAAHPTGANPARMAEATDKNPNALVPNGVGDSESGQDQSGGLFGRRLVLIQTVLEDDPFVELGKRDFDADLRKGQNGVRDQDFMRP